MTAIDLAKDLESVGAYTDVAAMLRKQDEALYLALNELNRVEGILLRECGTGVVNRIVITSIRELIK